MILCSPRLRANAAFDEAKSSGIQGASVSEHVVETNGQALIECCWRRKPHQRAE